jgi:predicted RNA-binding Zn-ribbon protein involved in translation (DUF1610 family)
MSLTEMLHRFDLPSLVAMLQRRRLRAIGHYLRAHWRDPTLPTMALCGELDDKRRYYSAARQFPSPAPKTILETYRKDLHDFAPIDVLKTDRTDITALDKSQWDTICQQPIRQARQANIACPKCGYHQIEYCDAFGQHKHDLRGHFSRRHPEYIFPTEEAARSRAPLELDLDYSPPSTTPATGRQRRRRRRSGASGDDPTPPPPATANAAPKVRIRARV